MKFTFKKNENMAEKPKKLKNKAALKHGAVAVVFTAIVVAVAVGVNVLMAVLAERVNLDVDISLQGDNTLTAENVKFIKDLDEKVTITVFSAKEDFAMNSEQTAYYEFTASDTTGTNDGVYEYYEQTLSLLELYNVYSKNITLKFVDPYDPSSSELTNKYTQLSAADIIVECEKSIGGESYTKSEVLHFDDIYQITEEENSYAALMGGGYGTVSGNNIETALTSAIFRATSDVTPKALVLEHHCKTDNMTEYLAYLEQNNFTVEKFTDNMLGEIDSDIDLIIIAQPTEDFASEELDAIDEWLANGELRGKGVMYFADPTGPDTPNLNAYLEEWGIAIEPGILYETEDNLRHPQDATIPFFVPATIENEDEVTKKFSSLISSDDYAISGGNAVLTQLFTEEGTRITTPIMQSVTDSIVIKPVSEDASWEPDGSFDKNQHISVLMASESKYHENILHTSYVCVFSSVNIVDGTWLANAGNAEIALNTAKLISGADEGGMTFTAKKMNDVSFIEKVTYNSAKAVNIICQWILPALLVAAGIFVFVRRARR